MSDRQQEGYSSEGESRSYQSQTESQQLSSSDEGESQQLSSSDEESEESMESSRDGEEEVEGTWNIIYGIEDNLTDGEIELASELVDAVVENDQERVIDLLEQGVPIDFEVADQFSALEQAITNGNLSMVRLLIEYGAAVGPMVWPTSAAEYAESIERPDLAEVIRSYTLQDLIRFREAYLERRRMFQEQEEDHESESDQEQADQLVDSATMERQARQRQQASAERARILEEMRARDATPTPTPMVLDRERILRELETKYGPTTANYVDSLLGDTDSPAMVPQIVNEIKEKLQISDEELNNVLERKLVNYFREKRVSPKGTVRCRNPRSLFDMDTLMYLESDDDLVVDSSGLCYTGNEVKQLYTSSSERGSPFRNPENVYFSDLGAHHFGKNVGTMRDLISGLQRILPETR